MKRIAVFVIPLLISNGIFSQSSYSADIDITIIGEGKVKIAEDATECSTSCNLTSTLAKNTLVAEANSGAVFSGWSGQTCTAGNQVFVDDDMKTFSVVPGGAKVLDSADINGDGKTDLASISLYEGKVSTLISNGDGTFIETAIDSTLRYPSALAFYDWDNDSDADLLVVEYRTSKIKLYKNDGLGGFSFSTDFIIEDKQPYALSVTDINDDNIPDLLISSFFAITTGDLYVLVNSIKNPDVSWYLNDGLDNFNQGLNVSTKAAMTLAIHQQEDVMQIAAAEILNDEIAVYTQIDETIQRTAVDNGRGSYGVAFGDVDKDGLMDLLATYYRPSELKLLYGQENNTFSAAELLLSPDQGLTATAFGDFNDDSYIDIASGEFNDDHFFYLKNNGYKDCIVYEGENIALTATFTTSQATPTPSPPQEVKKSSDSGGGAMNWYLVLLISGLISYRKK